MGKNSKTRRGIT